MKVLFILPPTLIWLSACATVNHGSHDYFRVDSVPQGATVTTSLETPQSKARRQNKDTPNEYLGCSPTPCAIKAPRTSKFIATIELEGYESVEIFIDSSTKQGALVTNAAVTSGTMAGVTVAGAATSAAVLTPLVQVGTLTVSSVGSAVTGGLIQPTVGAGVSTSSQVGVIAPPMIAVAGGMILTDIATGANMNLFPNPVVIGLPKKGTQKKVDPMVPLFREELKYRDMADRTCDPLVSFPERGNPECAEAKDGIRAMQKERRDLAEAIREALKEAESAAELD